MCVCVCVCVCVWHLWLNWLESAFGERKHPGPLDQKFKYKMGTDVIAVGKELTCNCPSLWSVVSVKTSTASA